MKTIKCPYIVPKNMNPRFEKRNGLKYMENTFKEILWIKIWMHFSLPKPSSIDKCFWIILRFIMYLRKTLMIYIKEFFKCIFFYLLFIFDKFSRRRLEVLSRNAAPWGGNVILCSLHSLTTRVIWALSG